jgi:hypothetical protein
LTVYTLRSRASLVSYRQRSWDSPFGAFPSRKVTESFPTRVNPHTVDSSVYPRTRGAGAGLMSCGFWALTLSRVPGDARVFSTRTAGCSLGFFPSRAPGKSLDRDFARSPLTRFFNTIYTALPAPQSIDWLLLILTLPNQRGRWGKNKAPSEGFCTELIPAIRTSHRPGLCVHLAPCHALLRALNDAPWGTANSTGAVGINWRC